jgi:hypothetical protein
MSENHRRHSIATGSVAHLSMEEVSDCIWEDFSALGQTPGTQDPSSSASDTSILPWSPSTMTCDSPLWTLDDPLNSTNRFELSFAQDLFLKPGSLQTQSPRFTGSADATDAAFGLGFSPWTAPSNSSHFQSLVTPNLGRRRSIATEVCHQVPTQGDLKKERRREQNRKA